MSILEIVTSRSNPNKFYEIRKSNRDGSLYCTCPAWRFSKPPQKSCKHVRTYECESDHGVYLKGGV